MLYFKIPDPFDNYGIGKHSRYPYLGIWSGTARICLADVSVPLNIGPEGITMGKSIEAVDVGSF